MYSNFLVVICLFLLVVNALTGNNFANICCSFCNYFLFLKQNLALFHFKNKLIFFISRHTSYRAT